MVNIHAHYLILVGYSSGVYRNIVLKDPVIAILPISVNTVELIIMAPFPPINRTNISIHAQIKVGDRGIRPHSLKIKKL